MNQSFTSHTAVRAIDIACPIAKAFDFMSDAQQWLPWALPEVESVQPLPFGQWLIRTTTGLAKLRPRYDATQGLLTYELVNAAAEAWHVPVQMVATPSGCQLAVTFTKPDGFPQHAFEAGVHYTTEGLRTLKLVLEQD